MGQFTRIGAVVLSVGILAGQSPEAARFEEQLGLKLEPKKRMLPVIVIDKVNQKPTKN